LFPEVQVSSLIPAINFRKKGEVDMSLCKDLMIMKSSAGKLIFKLCSFSPHQKEFPATHSYLPEVTVVKFMRLI